ncbi:hypothetical protein GPJ56_009953 [Histomonas meleagridis]|uniref:uncharacterized protein n=1 Tax=Histomonas meleagridis TaxID=135588 RepID=UPI00355AA415|nr:hypothetical protein GPJ56_009953 [Histomonas meleagridis]KAH0802740.1 hypothetical protein GO595_004247 [Histomonas meleagridis]
MFKESLLKIQVENEMLYSSISEEKQKHSEIISRYAKEIGVLEAQLLRCKSTITNVSRSQDFKKTTKMDWGLDDLAEEGENLFNESRLIFKKELQTKITLPKYDDTPTKVTRYDLQSNDMNTLHNYQNPKEKTKYEITQSEIFSLETKQNNTINTPCSGAPKISTTESIPKDELSAQEESLSTTNENNFEHSDISNDKNDSTEKSKQMPKVTKIIDESIEPKFDEKNDIAILSASNEETSIENIFDFDEDQSDSNKADIKHENVSSDINNIKINLNVKNENNILSDEFEEENKKDEIILNDKINENTESEKSISINVENNTNKINGNTESENSESTEEEKDKNEITLNEINENSKSENSISIKEIKNENDKSILTEKLEKESDTNNKILSDENNKNSESENSVLSNEKNNNRQTLSEEIDDQIVSTDLIKAKREINEIQEEKCNNISKEEESNVFNEGVFDIDNISNIEHEKKDDGNIISEDFESIIGIPMTKSDESKKNTSQSSKNSYSGIQTFDEDITFDDFDSITKNKDKTEDSISIGSSSAVDSLYESYFHNIDYGNIEEEETFSGDNMNVSSDNNDDDDDDMEFDISSDSIDVDSGGGDYGSTFGSRFDY